MLNMRVTERKGRKGRKQGWRGKRREGSRIVGRQAESFKEFT